MKINIAHTAKLASIPLSAEESTKLESQLEETLAYIERLNEVQTEGIIPTSQVTGLENVTREDVVTASFTQEEALKNSKHTYNGFFMVKALLEQ